MTNASLNPLPMIKSLIPAPLRRVIRSSITDVDEAVRARRLRFRLNAIRSAGTVTPEQIRSLRTLWGNPGWTVRPSFLDAMPELLSETNGPILDLGSGLTTALASALVPSRTVWSLDQNVDWVRIMQRRLGSVNVRLLHAPLREYDGFLWYDIRDMPLPSYFDLVICDGPSVYVKNEALRAAWRVGLVHVLREYGITFSHILADNMREPRGPACLAEWERMGIRLEWNNADGVALLAA